MFRARDVRASLREYLRRHATSDSDVFAAETIVAELVANVVRHARGSAWFYLDWGERHPTLVVLDGGPGFQGTPSTTLEDPYAESGRGLAIVLGLRSHAPCGAAWHRQHEARSTQRRLFELHATAGALQ